MNISIDKTTGVAFVDLIQQETDARIVVIDVSDHLDMNCSVLARVDEQSGELLGLIIEDYRAFQRELLRKYVALAAEKMIELIVSKVREAIHNLHGQRDLAFC